MLLLFFIVLFCFCFNLRADGQCLVAAHISCTKGGERCTVELVLSQNWGTFGVRLSALQDCALCCFLFHCFFFVLPLFWESVETYLLFRCWVYELDMLNKMLQHLISLLLDATLTVVVSKTNAFMTPEIELDVTSVLIVLHYLLFLCVCICVSLCVHIQRGQES